MMGHRRFLQLIRGTQNHNLSSIIFTRVHIGIIFHEFQEPFETTVQTYATGLERLEDLNDVCHVYQAYRQSATDSPAN